MADTVPANANANLDVHPRWCSADEPPGRSHRSAPTVVETDRGASTSVYLEANDSPAAVVLLVVEQAYPCYEHVAPDECDDSCDPRSVEFRLDEARAVYGAIGGLLGEAHHPQPRRTSGQAT
jgi:hypothetical protein